MNKKCDYANENDVLQAKKRCFPPHEALNDKSEDDASITILNQKEKYWP